MNELIKLNIETADPKKKTPLAVAGTDVGALTAEVSER
jgi:hypothetical protein